MSKLQFISITGSTGSRIINLHTIAHVEYFAKNLDIEESLVKMFIYFIGSPDHTPLILSGQEAENFWMLLKAGSLPIPINEL